MLALVSIVTVALFLVVGLGLVADRWTDTINTGARLWKEANRAPSVTGKDGWGGQSVWLRISAGWRR